jgi:hypothetical protein
MKKTVLLILLFISTVSWALTVSKKNRCTITQNVKQIDATRVAVQDSFTKELNWILKSNFVSIKVSTVSSLISYSGASTTLIVKDKYRGGLFNYDSTSSEVDNGITFIATGKGSGRWVRDTSNAQGSHVNWYGAKGDWNMSTNTGTDNAAAIQACINSRPNRNTCVVFGYGVYGSSTEIELGEGTFLKGMSTLFPKQFFGDGSISIDYTNMTAVKFYNNTNGFVTTLSVVPYRSQGIKIEGLGIFGRGKADGKTGLLLRQTTNSKFLVKTTGLSSTNYVFFSNWGIGADGTNSTDSWYVNNSHFSDCKTGLIGGNQTFLNFTDFFKLDDFGFILNSANEPDVVNGCEVETRFCSKAAALINGRVTISASQFLTNKKSIIFSSTATNSIVTGNNFHANSDTAITLESGSKDIQLLGNNFHADYYNNSVPNYDYAIEPANYRSNFINVSRSRVQINDNYFRKQNALYTGNPVLIDNSTVSAIGNTFSGFTFTNEKQFTYTGTNVRLDNYNIANTETVGNSIIGGNNTVTGKISAGVGAGSSVSGISSTGNTEDAAAVSSEAYGVAPTFVTRRAGGSFALPTATIAGDVLGQWKSHGYFSGFFARATIDFMATENWTSTGKGTAIEMSVTPIGTNARIQMFQMSGKGVAIGYNVKTAATAYLHLMAGTANANTAPLKLTTGTDLTTPEAGALEFGNGRLKFTPSTTRETIAFASDVPLQLKDFYKDVNTIGTSETDLLTYTVASNRLNAIGEKLIAIYSGTMNDITASSQLKVYFAGILIADTGALTMTTTEDWIINVSIIRTDSTNARAIVSVLTPKTSTSAYSKYTSLTGLNFTGTNILKITGTAGGSTGGSNDITATYGNIIWKPAAL